MDDFLDDLEELFDPTTATGVVMAAGSGLLDDERDDGDDDNDDERCACWCGCRRRVGWAEDECGQCWEGTHRDDR